MSAGRRRRPMLAACRSCARVDRPCRCRRDPHSTAEGAQSGRSSLKVQADTCAANSDPSAQPCFSVVYNRSPTIEHNWTHNWGQPPVCADLLLCASTPASIPSFAVHDAVMGESRRALKGALLLRQVLMAVPSFFEFLFPSFFLSTSVPIIAMSSSLHGRYPNASFDAFTLTSSTYTCPPMSRNFSLIACMPSANSFCLAA